MAGILSAFTGAASQVVFPTGTAAGDAAVINAAFARLPSTGGVVTMSANATWNLAGGAVTVNGTAKYLNAPGCYIKCSGTGDVIRMFDNSTYGTRTQQGGGILGLPFFDLTNMTGTSSAVRAGDIHQLQMFVSVFSNTPGNSCKGVWFDNQWFFTEQLNARIYTQSLAVGIQFDNSTGISNPSATGSFDRPNVQLFIDTNGVGDGVVLANGAFLADGQVYIAGNMDSNASSTFACLRLTGTNPGATVFSNITDCYLQIGVELDDASSHAPQTIVFNAANNNIRAQGYIDFAQVNPFAASNNTGQFLFTGPVRGDNSLFTQPSLGTPVFTQAVTANGQTIFTQWLNVSECTNGGSSFTGLILAAGGYTGQTVWVPNVGAGTLTFAAAATSHVADGAAGAIPANTARQFVWDGSFWYRAA